jgi:hypothetical protein
VEQPVTAVNNDERARLLKMFMLASEIVARKFGVKVDQGALLQELSLWKEQKNSYAQVGMKYLVLR